eukprot:COSAG05_NODE_2298_length_3258_cov_4.475467_2_plen_58_part_00
MGNVVSGHNIYIYVHIIIKLIIIFHDRLIYQRQHDLSPFTLNSHHMNDDTVALWGIV